jgi:hypothetical protein
VLSLGTHPKKVQELLGHSSILLTLDTYSHVLSSMHQEIAAQMDKLFEAADDGKQVAEVQPVALRADQIDNGLQSDGTLEQPSDTCRDEMRSILPSNAQNRR